MKAVLRRVHRIASLACVAVWLMQAITGVLLVFQSEMDDALLGGATVPLDVASIEARMLQLVREEPGASVVVVSATGGAPDRFDILLDRADGAGGDLVRVDGAGTVLRRSASDHDYLQQASFFGAATALHRTMLQGKVGEILVGISGLLLLTNVIIGLNLAWPRRGQWWRALRPQASHNAAAGLYAWHRALGLWLGIPAAFLLLLLGVLMAFEDQVKDVLGVHPPKLVAAPAEGAITAVEAIRIAQARFPEAEFGYFRVPREKRPWYQVRFRQDGEWRKTIGRTDVYVDARTGDVLYEQDALSAPLPTRIFYALYPLHTGEVAGMAGRIFVLVLGIWLVGTIGLGLCLWWVRRRPRVGTTLSAAPDLHTTRG